MLANTLAITYNSNSVTLTRVQESNFSSTYFGEDGDDKFKLVISHTIPERGGNGESHMIRLDVEHYASSVYVGTSTCWTVIKTFDSPQDSDAAGYTSDALLTLFDTTLQAQLIGRES